MPSVERAKAVWDAYERCLSRRYEIEVMAPLRIVAAADSNHRVLRDICITVADGATSDSEEYANLRVAYKEVHSSLRNAMRSDLGAEP